MFNVFKHEQLAKEAQKKTEQRAKQLKRQETQSKYREHLVKKHQRRVEQRFISMAVDPVTVNNPPSSVKTNNFVGEAVIRHQPNKIQRIEAASTQNQWLDTTPNPKPAFKLRQRQRQKELNGDMKYTPKNRYERIHDSWRYQKDFLNVSWMDKYSENTTQSAFPNRNNRTYFKTVQTIANNASPSIKCRTFGNVKENVKNLKKGVARDPFLPDAPKIMRDLRELQGMKYREDVVLIDDQLVDLAKSLIEKCNLVNVHSSYPTLRSTSMPK